jgi:hypothetical protein
MPSGDPGFASALFNLFTERNGQASWLRGLLDVEFEYQFEVVLDAAIEQEEEVDSQAGGDFAKGLDQVSETQSEKDDKAEND